MKLNIRLTEVTIFLLVSFAVTFAAGFNHGQQHMDQDKGVIYVYPPGLADTAGSQKK